MSRSKIGALVLALVGVATVMLLRTDRGRVWDVASHDPSLVESRSSILPKPTSMPAHTRAAVHCLKVVNNSVGITGANLRFAGRTYDLVTDENGLAVIDEHDSAIEAGRVLVSASGFASRVFSVDQRVLRESTLNSPVILELERMVRLSGRVTRSSKPLAGISVTGWRLLERAGSELREGMDEDRARVLRDRRSQPASATTDANGGFELMVPPKQPVQVEFGVREIIGQVPAGWMVAQGRRVACMFVTGENAVLGEFQIDDPLVGAAVVRIGMWRLLRVMLRPPPGVRPRADYRSYDADCDRVGLVGVGGAVVAVEVIDRGGVGGGRSIEMTAEALGLRVPVNIPLKGMSQFSETDVASIDLAAPTWVRTVIRIPDIGYGPSGSAAMRIVRRDSNKALPLDVIGPATGGELPLPPGQYDVVPLVFGGMSLYSDLWFEPLRFDLKEGQDAVVVQPDKVIPMRPVRVEPVDVFGRPVGDFQLESVEGKVRREETSVVTEGRLIRLLPNVAYRVKGDGRYAGMLSAQSVRPDTEYGAHIVVPVQ